MALTVNTNIFSLNAQRNLRRAESPLQQSLQRLSSGSRINSAKDDAAGFAITTRQTTQINGLSQAIRNANDGVSFAQTAEGAMDEMINALQRINELSIQSASNNTSTDRSSLNQEVTQLVAELNRIVSQTRYNGETFLNQQKSINVQVGTSVNEFINVSTANVSPTTMGVSTQYADSLGASDVAAAAFRTFKSGGLGASATLSGQDLGNAISTASDYQNNSLNIINRVNEYTSDTGVTAFGLGNALVGVDSAIAMDTAGGTVDAGYMTINGVQIGSFTVGSASAAGSSVSNIITAINDKATSTGVSAYAIDSAGAVQAAADSTSRIVLSNTSGAGISVSLDSTVSGGTIIGTKPFATGTTSVDAGRNGKIVMNAGLSTTSLTVDAAGTNLAFGNASTSTSISLTAKSVNGLSVSNVGNANVAILATATALDTISSQKAQLGAVQNRLATTVSNLDNVRENATVARSRIKDADFAEETANLTKSMILQQAGISILGQANQLPQNILALLQ